ncbi:MAG: hypothetical protein FWE93_05980, partial [Alphaproteobacteria bacterium]|nr:hypothetical protein [Alphaproteobacteria bacterium]
MLAWLYPPPPQLVEITRLLGKFFSLLVFIAGLLFAGNAYALDKICQVSGSSCVNIAQPFDWQKEWG